MAPTTDRRGFLKAALGGATAVALPGLGLAACGGSGGGASSFAVTSLTDEFSVLTGPNGANILAFSGGDGLVLVDSGAPDAASGLRSALRALPRGGNIRTVFNTHYHQDQTGGNAVLTDAGATIVAHERTKTWMSQPIWVPGELRYLEAREPEALPTQTFYIDGQLAAGGQTVDYGYLVDAHTDGDIYVFFREANVLAVGDLASPDRDPVFDWFAGGWLGGRIDAQAKLLEMSDESTRIVPAYGPVLTRAELEAERTILATLYDRVNPMFRRGRAASDFIKEGALEGLPAFADPDKLMYDIHKGLWGHQDALSHDIV